MPEREATAARTRCPWVLRWPDGQHTRCAKPADHARGDNHMGRIDGRSVWWVWFHPLSYLPAAPRNP